MSPRIQKLHFIMTLRAGLLFATYYRKVHHVSIRTMKPLHLLRNALVRGDDLLNCTSSAEQ